MEESSKKIREYARKIQEARSSLMKKQPFYAVLLLNMKISLDPMCETIYTDGEHIAFCPDYLDKLDEQELEFVMMHEVLHVALQHCFRIKPSYDFDLYNNACDIVVNSNIFDSCKEYSKKDKELFHQVVHQLPNGKEGYLYTAEEVYEILIQEKVTANGETGTFDDHTFWEWDEKSDSEDGKGDGDGDGDGNGDGNGGGNGDGNGSGDDINIKDFWQRRLLEATEIAEQIISINKEGTTWATIPAGVQRIIQELTKPQTDWRTILDSFIQEEITDYSFNPPDRRFQDSMFLLPDYNEKEDSVKDVLFMIDTSGSMSDKMITQAYSEIKGAIEQFNDHLEGWLGFFDAEVIEPQEFCDEEELKIIRPKGGGGTSFQCIFEYVQKHIEEKIPTSIVILTDGYAPFPDEKEAMDIPVLWIINNTEVEPPWGKVARITID